MTGLTLLRSGSELADPRRQVQRLEADSAVQTFQDVLAQGGFADLRSGGITTLQVNVGRVCNQTCAHCHVDAGPDRRESMSSDVVDACLTVLERERIPTLDITGGAPEMNPHFRRLVISARRLGCRVIDRCNLTILVTPGFEDLPEFLAAHQVEIVASLPCYLEANVDRQRGDRVFQRSLDALRRLNALGYGIAESGLPLNLVFNPTGPSLPPSQLRLEADYRRELRTRYGIEFTRLFTITNMPISRFLADLLERGAFEQYLRTLVDAFNPATLDGLMCRTMLSVDWRGNLFDCDFNQMLDLPITGPERRNILNWDASFARSLTSRAIVTGRHCFGCTAGAGSSCGGSLS